MSEKKPESTQNIQQNSQNNTDKQIDKSSRNSERPVIKSEIVKSLNESQKPGDVGRKLND